MVDSILSPDVRIGASAHVVNSILFDGVTVGNGARVSRCIVEKGVQIPAGTILDFDSVSDQHDFVVSEKGVIVIPRGYAGWAQHTSQNAPSYADEQEFASQNR